VTIAGAGVAGLATALLLARDGHRVTLVERDPVDHAELAPEDRRGIPHYLQPHALIPRARLELMETLPDVLADLRARGAEDADLRPHLPGDVRPEDELLAYLAVRRPQLEAALRRAALSDGRIEWCRDRLAERPEGDLVVDAMGRGSFLRATTETTDCGVVYYSRYYRQRPGFTVPDGPWFLSPRGDLGYFAYASFPGDNRTFAAVLAVPPNDADWKLLREAEVFERVVASIPALASWADPDGVEPLTDVLAMAGLRNAAPPEAFALPGYIAAGDALSHTDPVLAHGLAFALIHARALRDALGEHADVADVAAAYLAHVGPLMRERFRFASSLDEQRLRMWRGGAVDFGRDHALFSMAAVGAVARIDPEVYRIFARRIGLLDSTSVLDDDAALIAAIRAKFASLPPRSALGPSRDEMVALVRGVAT
jgi:2-polyprenyl-6-methoxyphenol hydroxylase-like FAD-dependent oxidoreductase